MASVAELVAVEMKRTDQVNVEKQMLAYLKSGYNKNAAKQNEGAVKEFAQLREQVRKLRGYTEDSVTTMLKYYDEVQSVDSKFPIGEHTVRLMFTWYDAYRPYRRCAAYSLALEEAGVLFNIAAIRMNQGAAENLRTDGGCKTGAQRFQEAAAVLAHIKSETSRRLTVQPSADLSKESLEGLFQLCVAQGQECGFHKAARNKMKPASLAKIAYQVYLYYAAASTALSAIRRDIPARWLDYIGVKQDYFLYYSYFQQSKVAISKDEYGAQIAFLEAAVKGWQALLKSRRGISAWVSAESAPLLAEATSMLNSANKDNDTVYHERIPSELPKIEGFSLVKVQPFKRSGGNSSNVFSGLVPAAVFHAQERFVKDRDSLIQQAGILITKCEEEANKLLTKLGLPGKLQASDKKPIPDSLAKKLKEVTAAGGNKFLQELNQQKEMMCGADVETISKIAKALADEAQDDEECAKRFGNKWTGQRKPSKEASKDLVAALDKHRTTLQQAQDADERVGKKLKDKQDSIALAMRPVSELEKEVPRSTSDSKDMASKKLRDLCDKLDQLSAERAALRSQLDELKEKSNVQSKLSKSSSSEYESVVAKEMATFQSIKEKLDTNQREHQRVLTEITNENDVYKAKVKSDGESPREAYLNKLEAACRDFRELRANMVEGVEFYANFGEILDRLLRNVEDWAFARHTQKQDLLNEIQNGIARSANTSRRSSRSPPGRRGSGGGGSNNAGGGGNFNLYGAASGDAGPSAPAMNPNYDPSADDDNNAGGSGGGGGYAKW